MLELTKQGARAWLAAIVCLPGDGIGPEVMAEAVRVLDALPLDVELEEHPFGGAAIDAARRPAAARRRSPPAATADAVLLGAVGGPKWDGGAVRPEQGLIGLRGELDVYANLRPARADGDRPADRARARRRPLLRRARRARRRHRLRHVRVPPGAGRAHRAARVRARARRAAAGCSSVDKANVLETSRLWRARRRPRSRADYPDVELDTRSSTAVAMQLVTDPERFDVLVTENTFGDILSDVAAAVTGGLGLAASASLGDGGPGIFEPVHGSAPDIAGTRRREPGRDAALASRCCSSTALGEPELRARARRGRRRRARHGADARPRRHRDDDRVRRRRPGRAGSGVTA